MTYAHICRVGKVMGPFFRGYSRESVVAEKFEAMANLDLRITLLQDKSRNLTSV